MTRALRNTKAVVCSEGVIDEQTPKALDHAMRFEQGRMI